MDETSNNTNKNNRLSATDHAIITCDHDELIISWDTRATKIFGWESHEAIGQKFFYLLLPPGPKSVPGITLADIISTGESRQAEQFSLFRTVQHKDGSTFDAHILIFDVPHTKATIVLLRDLRKQQRFLDKINIAYEQQIILEDIQKIATAPLSLELQYERILEYLFSISSLHLLPYGAIFLSESGTDAFVLKAQKGFSMEEDLPCADLPQGMCQFGQSAQYGTFKIAACSKDENTQNCHLKQLHGHFCSPLKKGDRVVGILCLYTEQEHPVTTQTEELLRSVCNILTTLVETCEKDVQLLNLVHDLRHSVNRLNEEKEFAESVLQGIPHGLIVTDILGNILRYNRVAELIMNRFSIILSGQNLQNIFGNDNAARLLACSDGKQGKNEHKLTITSASGDTGIIGYTAVSRKDSSGTKQGIIISIYNLTL